MRGDDFANHNMVIFVNSANEADRLGDLLESQCIGVLKATEFMSPIELKDIETSWNHEVKKKKHHDFVLGESHKFTFPSLGIPPWWEI